MNTDIQKAFHEAVSHNDIETARRMIAAGADVNAVYDGNDYCILMQALSNGLTTNLSICKLLLDRGSDYAYVNNEGRSAYTVSRTWKHIADFYDNAIQELESKK